MPSTWRVYAYDLEDGRRRFCRWRPSKPLSYKRPHAVTLSAPDEVPILEGSLSPEEFEEFLCALPAGSTVHID